MNTLSSAFAGGGGDEGPRARFRGCSGDGDRRRVKEFVIAVRRPAVAKDSCAESVLGPGCDRGSCG